MVRARVGGRKPVGIDVPAPVVLGGLSPVTCYTFENSWAMKNKIARMFAKIVWLRNPVLEPISNHRDNPPKHALGLM
jgi:hypothetical protein